MTFDEWYKPRLGISISHSPITEESARAAYEAGARGAGAEVERLREFAAFVRDCASTTPWPELRTWAMRVLAVPSEPEPKAPEPPVPPESVRAEAVSFCIHCGRDSRNRLHTSQCSLRRGRVCDCEFLSPAPASEPVVRAEAGKPICPACEDGDHAKCMAEEDVGILCYCQCPAPASKPKTSQRSTNQEDAHGDHGSDDRTADEGEGRGGECPGGTGAADRDQSGGRPVRREADARQGAGAHAGGNPVRREVAPSGSIPAQTSQRSTNQETPMATAAAVWAK